MNNDQKPRVRITIERISVTTMRTRPEKIYCEVCGNAVSVETPLATEPAGVIEAMATASGAENEKEK